MHHGAETNDANGFERGVVFLKNFPAKVAIAVLQAIPNIVNAVRPDPVFVLVLPLMTAGGNGGMLLTNQYCLDASRTEFDAKSGLSTLHCLSDIDLIHVRLPWFEVVIEIYLLRMAGRLMT